MLVHDSRVLANEPKKQGEIPAQEETGDTTELWFPVSSSSPIPNLQPSRPNLILLLRRGCVSSSLIGSPGSGGGDANAKAHLTRGCRPPRPSSLAAKSSSHRSTPAPFDAEGLFPSAAGFVWSGDPPRRDPFCCPLPLCPRAATVTVPRHCRRLTQIWGV